MRSLLVPGKATCILGSQFGDEGKGKFVDLLAQEANLVCRVQGGNNAGHTIWVSGRKVVTHLLPSGVLHPQCEVAIGAGVVVDPLVLRDEILRLKEQGFDLLPNVCTLTSVPQPFFLLTKHKTSNANSNAVNRALRLAQRAAALALPMPAVHNAMRRVWQSASRRGFWKVLRKVVTRWPKD